MFVSKLLVESILPKNLKQLNNYDNENLKSISETLDDKLSELKNELNELKQRSKLDKVESDIKKSENFIAKIKQLHSQIDVIKHDLNEQENLIKNVSQIEEYKNLIDHIDILNQTINVVQFLHGFETDLTDFKSAINEKNFSRCYDLLNKLDTTLKDSTIFNRRPEVGENNSPATLEEILDSDTGIFILKELKEDFKVERERLWYELDLEWDRLLKIDLNESSPALSSVRINREIDQARLDRLTRFSALKLGQPNLINNRQVSFVFYNKLRQFSVQFLHLCTQTVINNPGLFEIHIDDDGDEFRSLKFSEKSNTQNEPKAIDKLEIKLNQLETLFKFIYDKLFSLNVTLVEWPRERTAKRTPTTQTSTLIALFSALTLKEFTKLIYEQLIVNIIPVDGGDEQSKKSSFDCSMEAEICVRISRFERQLSAIGFMMSERGADEFKSFTSSVEELYVRKKCKHVIESAREMMRRRELIFELVDTRKMWDLERGDVVERLREIEKLSRGSSVKRSDLDELDLLNLPPCSISKLAKQVTDLVEETLEEAYKLMSENRENLKNVSLMCLAARNLFELYSDLIPVYYSSNLKNLPQLSAIVHNDLNYMARICLTLYHRYKTLLSSLKTVNTSELNIEYIELKDLINNFSFVDMVPKLCTVGFRLLNEQLSRQEENLIEYLNENSGSIRSINETANFELVKKSIQRCVFQITNLSNVWIGVLNRTVYLKLIGALFDLVCQDLLKSCLKLEDIETENSEYIHTAFSGLYQSVIEVFSRVAAADNSDEKNGEENSTSSSAMADLNAAKYIVSWNRFKYFLKILKANLVEIDDLWSEGKGPLALYYEPDEVRSLIRALFMNTDRRATVLAKIK